MNMRKITKNILVSTLLLGLIAGNTVAGHAGSALARESGSDGTDVIKANKGSDERIYCVGYFWRWFAKFTASLSIPSAF